MKNKGLLGLGILLIIILSMPLNAKAPQINVATTLSFYQIKIGDTLSIPAEGEEAFYKSSDAQIAYVNTQGLVIGKKRGIAIITVFKPGFETKKITVKVLAHGKLPNLLVCNDEVALQNLQITQNASGEGYTLSAKVKNLSKHETIQKVLYTFETHDTAAGTTTDDEHSLIKHLTLQTTALSPNQTSETITCEGPSSGILEDAKLITVAVYSGEGLVIYDMQKNSFDFTWGTEDITAPTISGMVGINSYNGDDVFMVAYPDKAYDFTKYVKVVDDRDQTVQLNVDTSEIDWTQKGVYNIIYSATDASGNIATAVAKVQVRLVDPIDTFADVILSKITQDSWSDTQKAEAIYTYVRKNISYIDSDDHGSWEKSALHGVKYKSGNCYVYYAVSRLLLTRSGIPNTTITRVPGPERHWWNLVYIGDGWYHFDTTPRIVKTILFLLTDEQMKAFSKSARNSHVWDDTLYHTGATKKISKVIMGRDY